MGDLQGPKIRIARFKNTKVTLKVGQAFSLSNLHPTDEGDETIVGIDYPSLVKDCHPGDELLLDDGRVVLVVENVDENSDNTVVTLVGPQTGRASCRERVCPSG